jgi:hypothetical protein
VKKVIFVLFAVLSLATPASSFGQVRPEQGASQAHFDQHAMNKLAASAKTAQDHQRLADYYREQAQWYINEARTYARQIAAYKRTPYLNSCSMCVTTSDSLEAAVKSLRMRKQSADENASEMLKLADIHHQMAGAAETAVTGFGL